MDYPIPNDFIDKDLIGEGFGDTALGFPEFMAGCLREVSISEAMKSAPLLVQRKVAFLSCLAHLFSRFENLDRVYEAYCKVLKDLKMISNVAEYDSLFDLATDDILGKFEIKRVSDLYPLQNVDLAVTSDVKNGQDSRHICDICKKSFKRKAFLKKHMKVHLVELEESKSRDGLENDNPEINKEEICGISGEQDIFFTIEGAYGNVEEFQCDACEGIFNDADELKNHIKSCAIVKLDIDKCTEESEKEELKNRLAPVKDMICDQKFTSSRKFAAHTRNGCRNSADPQMCAHCGRQYKNLAFHIYKTHSGRIFACDLCDFQTSLNCSLTKHIRQVHEGRTQTCDLCGKIVKELKHHKARGCPFVKKKPRHQCDHCDKSFALKDGLNRHIKAVHFKLKDKCCPYCAYTSAEGFNLRMHIARVHEGRKVSLQCPVCDKNVVSLEWHLQQYHKTQDISEFINAAESENKPQIIGRGEGVVDVGGVDPLDLLSSTVSVEEEEEEDISIQTSHLIFQMPNGL